MKRIKIGIAAILALLLLCASAFAIGPTDKVLIAKAKGATLTNHSAIGSSVVVGSCTAIDMSRWNGGTVQAVRATGSGTVSIQVMTCETATGTYVNPYILDTAASATSSGLIPIQAMATTAQVPNRSWSLTGIRSKYIKLVPTISGTATYTILFTPATD